MPILVDSGARLITPFCRGYGHTTFKNHDGIKSAQQVARGKDLIDFITALDIDGPIVGVFDWGGNTSCVAAILWPESIGGLVSYAGYDIVNIEEQRHSASAVKLG